MSARGLALKRVLDIRADGILVPMANNAVEACQVVTARKYPPVGVRGFGPKRASGYGRNTDACVAQAGQ